MKRAVYAGSFDPPTLGHGYIIERASALFDEVIVAIGENIQKTYTFSVAERINMLQDSFSHFKNVKFTSFSDMLLMDYAKSVGAQYIVRGIRSAADFAFEHQMKLVISKFNPDMEVVYLIPPQELAEVSSSLVKELIGSKDWERVVSAYVPHPVFEFLKTFSDKK